MKITDIDVKFTKRNWKEIFPFAPLDFEVLLSKPGIKERKMKRDNSFNLISFMYIYDIIHVLEKGIKENRSPNRKHTEKWKYFLENDIQEFIDNQHERMLNET